MSHNYPDIVKPCLKIIGTSEDAVVVGCCDDGWGRVMFIADATININPDARTLAEIAVRTARVAKKVELNPGCMLSFSNFAPVGS